MITDLRLQNFRSFRDSSFEFSSGVNIVVGPNASGKTNLLEAVLVLARGSSYRASTGDLIKHGRPWARLDSHDQDNNQRTVKIVGQPEISKTYEINKKVFKRLSQGNSLPVVLFEPDHLRLLSGGPDRRRDYLDDLLEQITPGYATTRHQYARALAQRNRLLKQSGGQDQLFPWNIRLSQLAGPIVRARSGLVAKINKEIAGLYKQLSQSKTQVSVAYDNRWPVDAYETKLLDKMESARDDDLARGFTAYGPHREDMLVTFGGRSAPEAASRGEIRTAVLALKIIELRLLQAVREGNPLLLLDDVFSELDGRRRRALTDYLAPYQTFITTTDADVVLHHFTEKCNVIALSTNRKGA